MHAELARFVITRGQDAAPIARPADANRLAAQRRPVTHLDCGIKAIHIEVNNRARRRIFLHATNVAAKKAISQSRRQIKDELVRARLPFRALCAMTKQMRSPATRVFMVRHGATVLSAEDRFAGATDVELSEEGREQTRRLAERLSLEKIVPVYSSPLGPTTETAQILAAPHTPEAQTP